MRQQWQKKVRVLRRQNKTKKKRQEKKKAENEEKNEMIIASKERKSEYHLRRKGKKKRESKNMKVKATCSERAGPRRLWPVSKVASTASCHGMQRILECHRRAEPRHAPKELELRIHAESVVNQRDWVSTTKKKREIHFNQFKKKKAYR